MAAFKPTGEKSSVWCYYMSGDGGILTAIYDGVMYIMVSHSYKLLLTNITNLSPM